jgi:hypothetical protein
VAQDAAVNCLRNFKNSHKPEGEAGDEKTVGSSLHVLDLLQLIQDNHTLSKFTDIAMSLCVPAQVRQRVDISYFVLPTLHYVVIVGVTAVYHFQ